MTDKLALIPPALPEKGKTSRSVSRTIRHDQMQISGFDKSIAAAVIRDSGVGEMLKEEANARASNHSEKQYGHCSHCGKYKERTTPSYCSKAPLDSQGHRWIPDFPTPEVTLKSRITSIDIEECGWDIIVHIYCNATHDQTGTTAGILNSTIGIEIKTDAKDPMSSMRQMKRQRSRFTKSHGGRMDYMLLWCPFLQDPYIRLFENESIAVSRLRLPFMDEWN